VKCLLQSLEEAISELNITEHEGSLYVPIESTSSSQSDEHIVEPDQHLNTFLKSCGIYPKTRTWQTWDNCSESTRKRYTKKSAEMVSDVLKTISPDETSASRIWDQLISTPYVSDKLGVNSLRALLHDSGMTFILE